MSKNSSFDRARKAKIDEFYTQLSDIEREMRYFRQHFAGRTVLCNADDPFESNFFKYFVLNFNRLGLRKLIATCYSGSPIAGDQLSIFDFMATESEEKSIPYKAVVNVVRDANGDGAIDMFDVAELFKSGDNELTELKGDGDFRSPECLELLEEADIVATNPPFSLFREYVGTLIEHKKHFIIIGSTNAISMKEIFPLLRSDKMWLGAPFQSGNAYFYVPNGVDTSQYAKGVYNPETRLVKFRNCCWYTNLDFKLRHETMILVKKYNPEEYPQYINLENGINVDRLVDIPCDYPGPMGVPITFMTQYNPDQFEVLGLSREMGIPGKTGMPASFIDDYFAQGGTAMITEGHPDLEYNPDEMLEDFVFGLTASKVYPERIMVRTEETIALLKEFCRRASIRLVKSERLDLLDEAVTTMKDWAENDSTDEIDQMMDALRQMSVDQIRMLPDFILMDLQKMSELLPKDIQDKIRKALG